MAYVIGFFLGFFIIIWVVYALLALLFKHKIAFPIIIFLGLLVGGSSYLNTEDFTYLILVIICLVIIKVSNRFKVNYKEDTGELEENNEEE